MNYDRYRVQRGRGGNVPRSVRQCLFPETLILTLRSSNPLPLGRGCNSRIDHYLVDRVPRLGDDKLHVHVRVARDHNGLGSGAVRVHGVGARARAPTRREVAVGGNCVNLCEGSVTIKRLLGEAIQEHCRPVWEEYGSVDGKGVAASYGGITASASVGHQGRRNDQSKRQEKQGAARFHWCLQIFLGGRVGPTPSVEYLAAERCATQWRAPVDCL